MVDFSQVIPFWMALPIGIGFVVIVYVLAKVVPIIKNMLRALREGIANVLLISPEAKADKEREGVFWYLSTICYILIFILFAYNILNVITYLQNSPPDVTIYQIVLGDTTIVTITLVLVYWSFKTIPYMFPRHVVEWTTESKEE